MMIRLSTCLAASVLFSTFVAVAPLQAGEFADRAAAAEALAADDVQQAAMAARAAYSDFMRSLPFTVINAVFVAEKPEGFGMVTAREPVFGAGEPLVVYCEPVGLKWVEGGRGYTSSFVVDVNLLGTDGTILGGQEKFGTFGFDSTFPNQEINTNLTLNVDGIAPGDYLVRYIFTDENSGEKAEVELPFTIR